MRLALHLAVRGIGTALLPTLTAQPRAAQPAEGAHLQRRWQTTPDLGSAKIALGLRGDVSCTVARASRPQTLKRKWTMSPSWTT